MNVEMSQRAFKALGDPTRLRIVQFLSQMCCAQATVDEAGGVYPGPTASEVCCHITGAQKISSTISHHLHELEAASLIGIERKGKHMVCSLNLDSLKELASNLVAIAEGDSQWLQSLEMPDCCPARNSCTDPTCC
jgi:ArsR family transcriptional regulator